MYGQLGYPILYKRVYLDTNTHTKIISRTVDKKEGEKKDERLVKNES